MNDYEILGVTKESTDDEIKSAYKKLAAKLHPDRGGDKEEFIKVASAYKRIQLNRCPMCHGTGWVEEKHGMGVVTKRCPRCSGT
jgi:DnaJ-class molecular chaperone